MEPKNRGRKQRRKSSESFAAHGTSSPPHSNKPDNRSSRKRSGCSSTRCHLHRPNANTSLRKLGNYSISSAAAPTSGCDKGRTGSIPTQKEHRMALAVTLAVTATRRVSTTKQD